MLVSMTPLRRFVLPAMLSGGLLWLAFFPVNAGAVALVALAPLLTLVRAPAAGRRSWRYLGAFIGGFVFFGLAIKWVRVADPMMALFTWPAGALYCALYWPMALFLLRRLDRTGLPFAVTLPIVWVGLEYVRTHFPTGYPFLEPLGLFRLIGFNWYALGYAMHGISPALQVAELGGVYLVSVMVAIVNGAAYDWLMRSSWVRKLFRWPLVTEKRGIVWEMYATTWMLILPVALLCFGVTRLAHLPYGGGPRVALVQGDLVQSDKMTPEILMQTYIPLARRAGNPTGRDPTPDLVIWPETCYPGEWDELQTGAQDPRTEQGVAFAQLKFRGGILSTLPPVAQLVGLNRYGWTDATKPPAKFNSAVLFNAKHEFVASYDKMHLVPFGEYVPLSSGILKRFTPYDHDYSCTPGTRFTRFPLTTADGRAFTFGMLICYEDSDPYLARQYNPASGRPGVDFLVNISNDGWFRETEEQRQHLAICQFRAVEARRSVVRAVNTGISAVIDPDGRVMALPDGESWAKSADRVAVVRAEVPISAEMTLYAALGDWVPLVCLVGYIGIRLWPWLGRRSLRWIGRKLATAADRPE